MLAGVLPSPFLPDPSSCLAPWREGVANPSHRLSRLLTALPPPPRSPLPICSGGWVPSDCRLLGLTKIPEYRNLWPSHHFGVEVVLKGSVIDTEANGGCVIS